METLALPFRVGRDGRLERTDRVTSLLSTVRAMAATPASAWPHAPWFGLYELFAAANLEREQQPALEDALNAAFRQLGVDWASVLSVTAPRRRAPGERRFDLALSLADGGAVHRSLLA